ncbi:MAG: hypothetical protein JW753_09380, partial [Dehalococcoidia bacterium]|nr:hypothetical protein [Dehalococcoidia bacterium]
PGTSVSFEWSSVTGAVDYKLLVSTSTNIFDTSKYKCNVNTGNVTTYIDTGYLGAGTKYYWWVWAYAADGTSSLWSQVSANRREFTNVPSIGTPALISPANAAEVPGASVSFEWSSVTGAVDYKLLVSTSTNVLDASKYKCNVNTGSLTTYLDTGYPANGTKYYWWVWAYDAGGGSSLWSQVSANRREFTSTPSLGAPALISPANGALIIGTSVSFEWSSVTGAVDYKLLVSTSTNILDTSKYKCNVNTGNVTTYLDTGYHTNGTVYYWWVWAYDAGGGSSLWSQVSANRRTFTNVPIAAPVLVSPANGASVSGSSVTFDWDPVDGAVDYKLLVSTSTNILDTASYKLNLNTGSGDITSYIDTGYPADGTVYYWWVWAYDAYGNASLWSQVSANMRSFTSVA